jgi:hypothetical protein
LPTGQAFCKVTAVLAVVLGLCALAVGPLLGPLLQRHVALAAAIDGFVVVTVTGLVVLHVLPQSVALGGAGVLPLAAMGVVVPALLHRFDAVQRPAAWREGRDALATTLLIVAAFGHALLDGVALIDGHDVHADVHADVDAHAHGGPGGHDDHGGGVSALALAVLLHRLPYGLALWVVGRERLGLPRTLAVLFALGAGTIAGAVVGDRLVSPDTAFAFALLQAFAAGAILHVLLEAPAVDVSGARRASSLGVVAGVVVLVALTRTHPVLAVVADELAFAPTLHALATTAAPSVVVGIVVVAALGALERTWRLRFAASAPGVMLALRGVVTAALSALCACRVGRVFESLLRRRAGLAGATALLVAAPHVEVVQALVSLALVGPTLSAVRITGAVAIAVVTAVVVAFVARAPAAEVATVGDAVDLPAEGGRAHAIAAVEHALPWLLVGLVAAAFLEPLLPATALAAARGPVGVLGAVALGAPLYLCAPAALPVALVFLHKGASAGAVVAFLLSAPAMNVTTFGVIARAVSRRAAVVFGAAIVVGAVVVGVVVDAVTGASSSSSAAALHALATTEPTLLQTASLVVVVVATVWSLVRQGARGFLAQIVEALDDAKGGHVHGPHCGHREHARAAFHRRAPVARVVVDFRIDDEGRGA